MEQTHEEIDRRSVITGIVCGAAVATFGLTVIPKAAKSLPSDAVKAGAVKPQDLIQRQKDEHEHGLGASGKSRRAGRWQRRPSGTAPAPSQTMASEVK